MHVASMADNQCTGREERVGLLKMHLQSDKVVCSHTIEAFAGRSSVTYGAKLSLGIGLMLLAASCSNAPVRPLYDPDTRLAVRFDTDTDLNGRAEARTYFVNGFAARLEVDVDEDGRVDRWEYYGPNRQLQRLGTSSQRVPVAGPGAQERRLETAID